MHIFYRLLNSLLANHKSLTIENLHSNEVHPVRGIKEAKERLGFDFLFVFFCLFFSLTSTINKSHWLETKIQAVNKMASVKKNKELKKKK